MVRNLLSAREALSDSLNSNVLDPYPGTRPGKHFLDESDGINLSRANTFPKGYIITEEDDVFNRKNYFYKAGFVKRNATFNIYYLVKDSISYDNGVTVFKDIDYANYMKEKIQAALKDNIDLGSGYYIESITPIPKVDELVSDNFPFKLYQVVISVSVKWVDTYGQN